MDTVRRTALLLVRHGQSTWNIERRWQGQADPPLSDNGRHQAVAASANIGTVDAIVSSPQMRALETAVIIGEQIGVGPIQTQDDLRERSAGEWSGLTTTEIETTWPGWIDSTRRPSGWEADDAMLGRVLPAIDEIASSFDGGTVLVVSHGGVIVTVEQHLGVSDGRIPNLHGRTLTVERGEIAPGERLALLPPELSTGGRGGRV